MSDAEYADQGIKLAQEVIRTATDSGYDLLDRLEINLVHADLSLPEDQGTEYFALMTAFTNEMQQELAREMEAKRAIEAGEN